MKYARIENHKVMEIIDFNPMGIFSEEMILQFVECDDNTKQNMTHNPETNEFGEPNIIIITPTIEEIRIQRDSLLNETDIKYCNAEKWELYTDEQKLLWREYKQQLRDLPETIDLDNVEFPTKPE